MDSLDVIEIKDYSNDSLLGLAERLESSKTFQAMLMRELELDEVWRRVDTALQDASDITLHDPAVDNSGEIAELQRLFNLVWQAHDLAGDGKPLEAAVKLREAMSAPAEDASARLAQGQGVRPHA